jgi:hypothetical protein
MPRFVFSSDATTPRSSYFLARFSRKRRALRYSGPMAGSVALSIAPLRMAELRTLVGS